MKIYFTKMHGCGNDFIMIDNRKNVLQHVVLKSFVQMVCRRKFHIGANGLMLLEDSNKADFSMRYFNSDGSEGEMCGNGARCMAKFAYINGIVDKEMAFETVDGVYQATILNNGHVQIYFPTVFIRNIKLAQTLDMNGNEEHFHYATVGVPHTVIFKQKIVEEKEEAFIQWARKIRYSNYFPKGTNVNIVEVKNKSELIIRTYERGVEEETLACGSGATASAIISALVQSTTSPVSVQTKGGVLTISFQMDNEKVSSITLSGEAEVVFTGSFMDK